MRRFSTSAHDSRDTILSAEVDLGRNTFDFALESKESPLPGANATFIPRPTRLVAVSRTSTRMAKIPTAGREYGRDAGEPAPRFRAFWGTTTPPACVLLACSLSGMRGSKSPFEQGEGT
jgi:hypothetical protein